MPDQTGKQPGDERAIKGQASPHHSPQHVPAQQGHVQTQHGKFGLGSTVQISDTPQYGVIRWIGKLPYVQGLIAGVELVSSAMCLVMNQGQDLYLILG